MCAFCATGHSWRFDECWIYAVFCSCSVCVVARGITIYMACMNMSLPDTNHKIVNHSGIVGGYFAASIINLVLLIPHPAFKTLCCDFSRTTSVVLQEYYEDSIVRFMSSFGKALQVGALHFSFVCYRHHCLHCAHSGDVHNGLQSPPRYLK